MLSAEAGVVSRDQDARCIPLFGAAAGRRRGSRIKDTSGPPPRRPACKQISAASHMPARPARLMATADRKGGGAGEPGPEQPGCRPTPAAEDALVRAVYDAIPTGWSPFQRGTFLDVLRARRAAATGGWPPPGGPTPLSSLGSTDSNATATNYMEDARGNFPGDPRWLTFYGSDVMVSVFFWGGACILLDRGADPEDASFCAAGRPLRELADSMQVEYETQLRGLVGRFWLAADAVDAGADPAALHSLDFLALSYSIVLAITIADLQLARMATAKSLSRQLVAIWKRAGIPPTRPPPGATWGLDDLLFGQHWAASFFIPLIQEFWTAAATRQPPAVDVLQDFGSVVIRIPAHALAALPAASERPPNGPIPPELLAYPAFQCRQYLGWLDPMAAPDAVAARGEVLAAVVTDLHRVGIIYLGAILSFAAAKIAEYNSWLREAANLSVLDVLIAGELLGRAPEDRPLGGAAARYAERLLRNQVIHEAIRRRQFLQDAVDAILAALPDRIATAYGEADFDALLAEVSYMPQRRAFLLVGYLAHLRQMLMVLVSPEPFEELDASGRRRARKGGGGGRRGTAAAVAHPTPGGVRTFPLGLTGMAVPATRAPSDENVGESGADGSDDASDLSASSADSSILELDHAEDRDGEDPLLELWFLSPSFAAATRNAMIISRSSRASVARFGAAGIGGNIFAPIACYAATQAAWLHLLTLRRFARLAAASTHAQQARAADLHGSVVRDVEACLELLAAAGRPAQQGARLLLQGMLDGEVRALTGREMGILRLAREVAARCPHTAAGFAGPREGRCWICAAEGAGGMSGDDEADEDEDEALGMPAPRLVRSTTAGSNPGALGHEGPRRVRFADRVSVHDTWTKDEYRARSMLAPYDPELDAVPPPGPPVTLAAIIGPRLAGEGS
ncbi:hypothetical protein DFJ74DRAFT_654452 [Hyaloraphidium curvatum]|nr:hypothetical protein DFJ74DRAFT_654452 [Hyaloraphidium curvatum]